MAILRTHTGATLDRPVQRLYPLELEEDEERSVEKPAPIHPPNSMADITVPALRKAELSRSQYLITPPVAVTGPVPVEVPVPVPVTSGRGPQCVGTSTVQQSKQHHKRSVQSAPSTGYVTRTGRTSRPTWKLRGE